ncbi:MAG TPA: hypothetical protein VG318_04445 [Actinomycetota bacterium]|nr:hypothetical protein [Actinomycetota bacterium]
MRRIAAGVGAVLGALAFAPAFCVTQHSDPGPTTTRCQALVHWLPPLRGEHAPDGLGRVAFVVAGAAAAALLLWLLAAPFDRARPPQP